MMRMLLLVHYDALSYHELFTYMNTEHTPQMLLHIFLSLFTFCILLLAGLLAVLLALQERLLRFNKKTSK